jgi:hypothetical protein
MYATLASVPLKPQNTSHSIIVQNPQNLVPAQNPSMFADRILCGMKKLTSIAPHMKKSIFGSYKLELEHSAYVNAPVNVADL